MPKRCEGTEINTVRKGISAINHTFTEKICMHAVCILALKKLKCMSASDLTTRLCFAAKIAADRIWSS